jgi:hypothetical protein
MNPAERPFPRPELSDDRKPNRTGNLKSRLKNADLRDAIKNADFIMGIDPNTGACIGLFHGVDLLGRTARIDIAETAEVLNLEVDPKTDDVDVLCEIMKAIKGSHCFSRGSERVTHAS